MSILQYVERGKRLEVEETLGYAVQQGAALGIPMPTMDVCYNLIAGLTIIFSEDMYDLVHIYPLAQRREAVDRRQVEDDTEDVLRESG